METEIFEIGTLEELDERAQEVDTICKENGWVTSEKDFSVYNCFLSCSGTCDAVCGGNCSGGCVGYCGSGCEGSCRGGCGGFI